MPDSEPSDDLTILDEAELWRRIPPHWIIFDKNRGAKRPSSAAFDDHQNGSPMSVLLADLLSEVGRGASDVLADYEGYALAAITAGLARRCKQVVVRAPLRDVPAHAEVVGKKTDSVRKRFAVASRWVLPPP